MQLLPAPLAPLAAYRQWVLWRAVPSKTRPGKVDKFPCDRLGNVCSAHKAEVWLGADEAIACAASLGLGVGFVFTAADPFWFVDIDGCLEAGGWSPLALELCGRLAGAAVEVSQSGTGLHIIGTGRAPDHGCKNAALGLEFYTADRFVALTGTNAVGSAAVDCSAALPQLVADYFPPVAGAEGADWTSGPRADWAGFEDDGELVARALASSSAASVFGGGRASFRDLWEHNADALARAYPDPSRPYDASQADAALAQHLAFWTGADCDRMLRLCWQSGLVRDKWQREDYLQRTILRAAALQESVHSRGSREPEIGAPPPEPAQPTAPMGTTAGPQLAAGLQFLAVTQQLEHFRGCVYVRDLHRVFTPDGAFLKADQFRAMFGGYVFSIDATNEKTTKNAWEAFTESQAIRYPKAAGVVFRPELPPAALVEEEGHVLVNTYIPVETRAVAGDPRPFLDLLERVLPVERDRQILLTYIAACVQHKGRKFQWWPVLQGVEGNGKTLIISAVVHALGSRYSFCPNVEEIAKSGNKFNGWIRNRLFVGMEEVYVAERRDFLNAFKTTVTNERLPIESKGVDQIMCDNRANGLMCTNYRAGVPIGTDSRRYAVFFTAQQEKADLARDGMDGAYFPELYDWAKGRGRWAQYGENYGFAVVNDYLQRFELVEEFSPAGLCQRAPETSSTAAAITESRGTVEQEILEAIEEGRPGFCAGWVSSMALERLLSNMKAARAIPHTKRRELLDALGYAPHPALRDGRVVAPVQPDGGRPRLFIRKGHIHANLTDPGAVARHYSEAQAPAGTGTAQAIEVFSMPR